MSCWNTVQVRHEDVISAFEPVTVHDAPFRQAFATAAWAENMSGLKEKEFSLYSMLE
jgi:hypothetical protein